MKRAVLALSAAALLLASGPVNAHLMPAKQGSVNIVGTSVFAAVSIPTSALHDADDNGDGMLDVAELEHHEESLRAEIDRRLVIADGEIFAATVRVDLMLSPQHDAAPGRAEQVIALKHARFESDPRRLRVSCDLFGTADSERELTFTATRHPSSGTETEIAVLRPGATDHAFFSPAPVTSAASDRMPWGIYVSGGVLLALTLALMLTWGMSRMRVRQTRQHPARTRLAVSAE